jgi:hypothetical protein
MDRPGAGLARDATSLYGTVSQLGGADFGRYFNGRNAGFLAGLSSPYAGASSVGDLISTGAALRQQVGSAADVVTAAIGGLGVGTAAADVATAVQGHVAALQASAADPADGLRILSAWPASRRSPRPRDPRRRGAATSTGARGSPWPA